MDFGDCLEYLYGLQKFGIKLGLDNVRTLLERLGHPERSFKAIHVAGTNGKGSVSACLAEILTRAGYRAGLYTSPHLHSFTERIRVNGALISETQVAALTQHIRVAAEGVPCTFFEFTTVLSLEHFRREGVDFAVLEVGMGGRLDATNAVLPEVSAITPVSMDHGEYLGQTLSLVAAEKGGIIKEGVPVVLGRQQPDALEVLQQRAEILGAKIFRCGLDFGPLSVEERFRYRGLDLQLDDLSPVLPGRHQHDNLSQAICVAEVLRRQGVSIPEDAIRAGVEAVRWPGRLEWWGAGRTVLLDGAHNEAGARVLADYLRGLGGMRIRWVAGIKGDKDAAAVLEPLLPLVSAMYCVRPPVDVSIDPVHLVETARGAGVSAWSFDSTDPAMAAALEGMGTDEMVLVAGSLFLVAAARDYLIRLGQGRDSSMSFW